MNALPKEILLGIFKRLGNEDINLCGDVCENWRTSIYDSVGLTSYIGNPPDYFPVKYKTAFCDVQEMGKTGLHSLVISNLDDQELPKLLSPHLMKNFQIFGSISLSNFNKLLTPMENLSSLSFHVTSLTTCKFEDGRAFLKFPKLKRLIIFGDQNMIQQFMGNLPTHDVLWSNLTTLFLNTEFPKLQVLNICEVPLVSTRNDTYLVEALVIFMVSHRATLQTLEFSSCSQLINPGEIPVFPYMESTDIKEIQLNTCDILFNHNESQGVRELFDPIIAAQSSLKHFLALSEPFCPDLIQRNSGTLVRVELQVNFEPNHIIDFQVFENCLSLKSLVMIGSLEVPTTVITNTKFLVSSMDSIRLIAFNLSTTDASDLVTKDWKLLSFLELQYIGVETVFGVPFSAICGLLNLKKIIHVFISNGINKNSVNTAKQSKIKVSMPTVAAELLGIYNTTSLTPFEINISLGLDQDYVFGDREMGRNFSVPEGQDQIYIREVEVYPEAEQIAFGVGMLI